MAGAIKTAFSTEYVYERALFPTDPNDSFGIDIEEWNPEGYSIGQHAPMAGHYLINVYAMVKHLDTTEGRAMHARRTRKLRQLLSANRSLHQTLGAIKETQDGVTERFQMLQVSKQIYRSGSLGNETLFLSLTQVLIKTETVGGY